MHHQLENKLMKTLIAIGLLLAALLAVHKLNTLRQSPADGKLVVNNVTANLALPMPNGAIYMIIDNGTANDDALIGIAMSGCEAVELHEMKMEGDVMQMHQLEDKHILIPAGQTVTLQRGDRHAMCIGKSGEFTIGQSVPVTLTFQNAGEIKVMATILDPAKLEP